MLTSEHQTARDRRTAWHRDRCPLCAAQLQCDGRQVLDALAAMELAATENLRACHDLEAERDTALAVLHGIRRIAAMSSPATHAADLDAILARARAALGLPETTRPPLPVAPRRATPGSLVAAVAGREHADDSGVILHYFNRLVGGPPCTLCAALTVLTEDV